MASNLAGQLRPAGRAGASIFAACCVERLRPILQHVPSGAPPLVAGVALTELWRTLEGLQRPDPRRLNELSQACWTLVEIEPVPKIPLAHLEALTSATHLAIETYLSGNPEKAVATAAACAAVGGPDETLLQERDVQEIAAGSAATMLAKRLRERAEQDGAKRLRALLKP